MQGSSSKFDVQQAPPEPRSAPPVPPPGSQTPDLGAVVADMPPPEHRGPWSPTRPVLYPNVYVWFLFVAALDLICTWMILALGGAELNWLARLVIDAGGLWGTSAYKFGLAVIIIGVCEFVGRRRFALGRRLAKTAVLITCVPVVVAMTQLIASAMHPHPVPAVQ